MSSSSRSCAASWRAFSSLAMRVGAVAVLVAQRLDHLGQAGPVLLGHVDLAQGLEQPDMARGQAQRVDQQGFGAAQVVLDIRWRA